MAWETTRGNSYLVLVGKKTGTADAAFRLDAQLFLPPSNDSPRQPKKIALGTQINGTTLGATSDDGDPNSCGLAGGTIWYSVSPGRKSPERSFVCTPQPISMPHSSSCARFARRPKKLAASRRTGRATPSAAWDVERGAVYLVAIGQRKGSSPGDFTLQALAAQPREAAPGQHLARGSVRSRVDWLTDVNDVWWTTFVPGTTYRIAFSSEGCAALTIRGKGDVLRSFKCGGYTTFTPGPKAGGRYVFEVTAQAQPGTTPYRLTVRPAGPDDVGVGLPLANLATVRGTLAPRAGDVVDLYHFEVAAVSDVHLRLEGAFSVSHVDVRRRAARVREVRSTAVGPGNYVAAVRASPGASGGAYRVTLIARR